MDITANEYTFTKAGRFGDLDKRSASRPALFHACLRHGREGESDRKGFEPVRSRESAVRLGPIPLSQGISDEHDLCFRGGLRRRAASTRP